MEWMDTKWYHVCWPRLTAKRVEPVVTISWASCIVRDTKPRFLHLYRTNQHSTTTNSINCNEAAFQASSITNSSKFHPLSRCHVIAIQMSTPIVTCGSKTNFFIHAKCPSKVSEPVSESGSALAALVSPSTTPVTPPLGECRRVASQL